MVAVKRTVLNSTHALLPHHHNAAIKPRSPITPTAHPGIWVRSAPFADFTALVATPTTLEAWLPTLDAPLTATEKTDVAPLMISVVKTLDAPLTATEKTDVAPLTTSVVKVDSAAPSPVVVVAVLRLVKFFH